MLHADLSALGAGLLLASAAGFLIKRYVDSRRRLRLRSSPLTGGQIAALQKNVPFYTRLPKSLQADLQGRVRVFLDEKNFEGCAGLEVTEEIRLTIAAQACVLLLNREVRTYPELVTVLVYPSPFNQSESDGAHSVHLGESWVIGTVILAWDHVLRGAKSVRDGKNVVFHEFAHQLDQEDKVGDGTPRLGPDSSYAVWGNVLGDEFVTLCEQVNRGKKTFLDPYGATNEAEFFAVVTEFFFERADALSKKHPGLYEEMMRFYQQDPRDYSAFQR